MASFSSIGPLCGSVLLALVQTVACASSDAAGGSPGASGGVAGSPPTEAPIDDLVFVPSDPLLLTPGQSREITVRISPTGFHRISFSLVADENSESFDGFLESAESTTEADGLAHNVLTAPSRPGVFRLRASASEKVYVELPVSVGEQGFASLVVQPSYAGSRPIESWTATAYLRKTCADLPNMWDAGELIATSSKEIRLNNLPVVDSVAVVARAGHFISGCTTVLDLVGNEAREVNVSTTDRPLQLTGSPIPLVLGIEETTDAFIATLTAAAEDGALAVLDENGPGSALLAAMEAQVPSKTARGQFAEHATSSELADALSAHFKQAKEPHDAIAEVLLAAATRVQGLNALNFSLEFAETGPTLVLQTAAGVPATKSGFLGSSPVSLEVQAGDLLIVGSEIRYQATQFLYAIANTVEEAPAPEATGTETGEGTAAPPSASLRDLVDCAGLASVLVSGSSATAYESCGESCLDTLCADAIEALWGQAGTSGKSLSNLRIGITATATVDDEAHPRALSGTWVGSLDSGVRSVAGSVRPPDTAEIP